MKVSMFTPAFLSREGMHENDPFVNVGRALADCGVETVIFAFTKASSGFARSLTPGSVNKPGAALRLYEPKVVRIIGMPPQFFSRSLVKDLVREPSDIVHIHGCSQLSILYPILKKAEVPVVLSPYHICDPHLSLASTLGSRVLKRSLSHLGKRIARFIVERSEDKTRVLQCGTPDRKIALLYHTIDYVKMVSTPRSEEEMILTVGRYAVNKGLHNLIDAAKVVLQTFPNIKFYIVGSVFDREYYNLLREKVLGFESHIHVTGPMEEGRLLDLFSRARLFVFPALEETRGLVNLEAMAAGIPVIASNLESTALMVKDGVNGILVSPDNVHLLVESILSLWKDKEKRAGLARNGQETAKTYYWEEYALRLTRLYSEVVS